MEPRCAPRLTGVALGPDGSLYIAFTTPRGPDGTSQTKLFKSNGEETITAADGTITTVLEGPDPRFGMQSPIPSTLTITTPSGLTATTTTTRGATLADPGELMSLTALNDTVTVNGEV